MKKEIVILGIESSCDETAAAVSKNGREICSNVISSQIETHSLYGGVVPEIASRKHLEVISAVVQQALKEADVSLREVDAIAVTAGPGLVGALLVGVSFAKALAYALNIPLIPVHHIEGHIAANYIENKLLNPPFICIVASGGHSHIVYAKDYLEFEILGQTRDDAAGEAFDKVARILGLGYPGGPKVEKLAKEGSESSISFPKVKFTENYDFSFSGVKTAVMNYVHNMEQKGEEIKKADVAAAFQASVLDVLVENTIKAAKEKKVSQVCMAGGVASNGTFRKKMKIACDREELSLSYPKPILCTDNAAMIACAGYYELLQKKIANLSLNAYPTLKLGKKIVGS